MAGFLNFLQTIIIPALFALALYLLLTYLLIPLYQRHRNRYANYLPLTTSSTATSTILSTTTTTFSRTTAFIREHIWSRIFLPGTFTLRSRRTTQHASPDYDHDHDHDRDDTNSLFGDEEGESMVGFDTNGLRQTGPRGGGGGGGRGEAPAESDRRLSRELEEGFRDDSDEEEGTGITAGRRTSISR